jgi:hypothetical protein
MSTPPPTPTRQCATFSGASVLRECTNNSLQRGQERVSTPHLTTYLPLYDFHARARNLVKGTASPEMVYEWIQTYMYSTKVSTVSNILIPGIINIEIEKSRFG